MNKQLIERKERKGACEGRGGGGGGGAEGTAIKQEKHRNEGMNDNSREDETNDYYEGNALWMMIFFYQDMKGDRMAEHKR